MTALRQPQALDDARPASIWNVRPLEIAALAALIVIAFVARLPFWPRYIQGGDALNYYFGALSTHVAHPPGSIAYCVVGGWLNDLIGHIQTTYLLISFFSSAVATALIHFLAKSFGLRWPAALVTAALYCFSINTQYASLSASPHVVEAMFTIIIALLAREAIRTGRPGLMIAMTVIFAVAGAFRPTTTFFLAPLWLYVVVRFASRQGLRGAGLVVMQCAIAGAIVFSWHWANEHYMEKAGYGHKSFEVQALMPSVYEYSGLSPKVEIGTLRLTFHMPSVEFLAWIEVKTGWHLLPHMAGWPTPSLKRAGQLALMQLFKQTWWLILAAPFAAVLPVLWIVRRRWFSAPARSDAVFLLLWILPAALFFVVGHMGAGTYLQVYLPAVCIGTACLLLGKSSGSARVASKSDADFAAPLILLGAIAAATFLGFTFARPFADNSGLKRWTNMMLLQYTGQCLREGTGFNRLAAAADAVSTPDTDDYAHAKSDADLLRIARREQFVPVPIFPNEVRPPPP